MSAAPNSFAVRAIYFAEADGLIKIGVSGNPLRRMRELEAAGHVGISLLATMPGSLDEEHRLHRLFDDFLVDGTREWFRPSPFLLEFIEGARRGSRAMKFRAMRGARRASKIRQAAKLIGVRESALYGIARVRP